MATHASSDLVQFGMVDETTEGTLETGSAVPIILTNGITTDYTTNIISDTTVSGAGETLDAQTNLRGLNLTTPVMLRFSDCRPLIAAQLRETFATAVSVVGSSDIDVTVTGTHNDGTTSASQIKVTSTSAFDSLIGYGPATTNGIEGLLLRSSGFTDAKNNGYRRVKEIWKDGTTSYIDIEPGWVGGSAGLLGEPMAAETGATATLTVGRTVRNRVTGSGVISKTALWQFTDMATYAKYGSGFGLVANDLTINGTGKDGISIEVTWIGYGSKAISATDPTGQGFAADANLYSDMLIGTDQLKHFAIVTATKPIVLSSLNLTGYSMTIAGNCAAIDNTSGTSEITGVRRGSHAASGSVDWYLVNDERSEELTELGAAGSEEKAEISVLYQDAAGNDCAFSSLRNQFGTTGPTPGSQGSSPSGSLNFTAHRKSKTSRLFVYQEIAA